jgi:hypothetical protein
MIMQRSDSKTVVGKDLRDVDKSELTNDEFSLAINWIYRIKLMFLYTAEKFRKSNYTSRLGNI